MDEEHPATIAPETTAEQDRTTAGQRAINRVWEYTQAVIALTVTATAMYTASALSLGEESDDPSKAKAITAFLLISNTLFLVVGFYFGRTNHTKVGGVGANREESR